MFKKLVEGLKNKINKLSWKIVIKRYSIYKINDIPVVYNDKFFHKIAPKLLYSFIYINPSQNIKVITVDNNFIRCTEDVRDFLLYHEAGHCYAIGKGYQELSNDRYIEDEYRADALSASVVGKDVAIKSLNTIKEKSNSNVNTHEIDLRIQNLLQL